MRIQKTEIILNKIPEEDLQVEIQSIISTVKEIILSIEHPVGASIFKINPNPSKMKNGKIDKHPNGVQYIKHQFATEILKLPRWSAETKTISSNIKYKSLSKNIATPGWGPLDFCIKIKTKIGQTNKGTLPPPFNYIDHEFVVEWETGNVSSSHRSINKMISTMFFSNVVGGLLIVPTAELKQYITDRVGNYEELEPYFPLWKIQSKNTEFIRGYLEIIGVSYDELDSSIEYLPKGQDGNAYRFQND